MAAFVKSRFTGLPTDMYSQRCKQSQQKKQSNSVEVNSVKGGSCRMSFLQLPDRWFFPHPCLTAYAIMSYAQQR